MVCPRLALVAIASTSLVAQVGCLREPKFTYRDAGEGDGDAPRDGDGDAPGDGASAFCQVADGQVAIAPHGFMDRGWNVCARDYQILFSDTGARMPYSFRVRDTELAARGDRCLDEQGFGIGVYPAGQANATDGTGIARADMQGPYIAKVGIDWNVPFNCSDGSHDVGTRSTFTMFPDGRITRYDKIVQLDAASSSGCQTCQATVSNEPFYLTSFMTLAAENAIGSGFNAAAIDSGGNTSLTYPICMEVFGQRVAVTYMGSPQPRLRLADDAPRSFAFVHDFARGASSIGPYPADAPLAISTTILVGDGDRTCSQLRAAVSEYGEIGSHDIRIYREGQMPAGDMGLALDGIYGGEVEDSPGGFGVAGAPAVPILITAQVGETVQAGFAVWLLHDLFFSDFTVEVNGSPRPARWQRVNQNDTIFWFDFPLDDATIIKITPMGS